MIHYKDKTFCQDNVEIHTCNREFTEQDKKDAKKWWGSDDYPVAYASFCLTKKM
jgi:hypothetical protein